MDDRSANEFLRWHRYGSACMDPPLDPRVLLGPNPLDELLKEIAAMPDEMVPSVLGATPPELVAHPPAPSVGDKEICIGKSIAGEATIAASATEAIRAPVKFSCPTDQFPLSGLADALLPHEDAFARLKSLSKQIQAGSDYSELRLDFCIQSIRMNLEGRIAPAYRPAAKRAGAFNDPIYHLIHRDQQVIDLHWCHATEMMLLPSESRYADILEDRGCFDFDAAWGVSGRKWKKDFRATEALCLTVFQQCQLVALRSDELTSRERELDEGRRGPGGAGRSKRAIAKRCIAEWVESDKRIASQRHDYEWLWLARELLTPRCSMKSIAELHALMCGRTPLEPKTVRDKLKKLDQRLSRK